MKNPKRWFSKGNIATGTLFLVGLMLLMGYVGVQLTSGLVPTQIPENIGTVVTPKYEPPEPNKNNLQLYTFGFMTPVPTQPPQPTQPPLPTQPQSTPPPPPSSCNHVDEIKTDTCNGPCLDREAAICDEKPCESPGIDVGGALDPSGKYNCVYQDVMDFAVYGQKLSDPNCLAACFGKPVIYLYPVIPMLVDVELVIPGRVTVSDPLYPEGGWKNVLAYPNGTLVYQKKTYKELYYESQVDKVNAPDTGVVIPTKDLQMTLASITTKLGLVKHERDEFLEYWLPRLQELNAPYILFSLVDPVEKERTDHVNITPEPMTRIEFLAYFKPQQEPTTTLKPLKLPEKPPERIGFTAVEWGGTIAY